MKTEQISLMLAGLLIASGLAGKPNLAAAQGFAVMAANENGAFGSALGSQKRPSIQAAEADCKKKAKGKNCYWYWTKENNHAVLWFCSLPGLSSSGVDGFFGQHSTVSLADARKRGMALLSSELKKVGFSLNNVKCREFSTYSKGKFRKMR